MRIFCAMLLVVLCFVMQGCSKNAQVSGKVTFEDGAPLTSGTVIFDGGQTQAKGNLGQDGTYKLSSLTQSDGIPPGSYNVCITGAFTGGFNFGTNGGVASIPTVLIDPRFSSPETSGLMCNVSKGKMTFDIKVTPPPNE